MLKNFYLLFFKDDDEKDGGKSTSQTTNAIFTISFYCASGVPKFVFTPDKIFKTRYVIISVCF